MKIQIACLDDHQLFLDGLCKIFQSREELQVTGCFSSPKAFMHALNELKSDVITLDVEMAEMNGLDVCKNIKELNRNFKVLFISMFETRKVIDDAKKYGADGFISKNAEADEVVRAVKEVYNGENYFIQPTAYKTLIPTVKPSIMLLTPREKQIMILIRDGKTSKEIAQALYISEYTVETHRKNIFRKLKLKSLQELIGFVYEHFK